MLYVKKGTISLSCQEHGVLASNLIFITELSFFIIQSFHNTQYASDIGGQQHHTTPASRVP